MRIWMRRVAFLLLIVAASPAMSATLLQGIQYKVIPGASRPESGQPVVIQEFFWYGCPHCFRLDPMIARWAKQLPNGIVFRRVPDALGRLTGVVDQKAYYIARFLGILPQTHGALFNAIHVKHRPMGTLWEIRDLYVSVSGISDQQFDQAAASGRVRRAVRRANQLTELDGVVAVPTLVIGGYYKTDGTMAAADHPDESEMSSYRRMLAIAETLARRLHSQLQK